MNIEEYVFNDNKYVYIGEYQINDKLIYKFSNKSDTIYCEKSLEGYIPIDNRKLLKKIKKEFLKQEYKDVI